MLKTCVWGSVGLWVVLACTAVVRSEGVKVGDKAPNFKAESTEDRIVTLDDFKDAKVLVVCFTCNNCPVAVAYEDRFIEFNKKYADKGVQFVAINPNANENLEAIKKRTEDKQINYPYVHDGSGKSAVEYGAKVTPHLFVIDQKGLVAYIGSFDDEQATDKVKKHFVTDAVDALLAGKKPETTEHEAFGCSIKFKR